MEIRAEVTAVETHGDTLRVTLQGKGKRDAEWRRYGSHSLTVPATPQNGRVYHVGKIIKLVASPCA